MKRNLLVSALALTLAALSGIASAVTVNFNKTECPTCSNVTPPVVGPEWAAYGISNVGNAYWYTDSRDTFDGMGLSINTGGTAVIQFASVTPSVTFDYWAIRGNAISVSAYDSTHSLLGTFSDFATDVGDKLGTSTLGGGVQFLEWTGNHGFAQISTVIFAPVPEPEIYAMMGMGLAFMGFVTRRKQRQGAAA